MTPENDWQARLHAVDWSCYRTIYGAAANIPEQISRLHSSDENVALSGAADLRAGLCHQNVQIASAAVPALPFILGVLPSSSAKVAVEILELLTSFALTTDAARMQHFASAVGKRRMPQPGWVGELRTALRAALPQIAPYATHEDAVVAELARMFVDELGKNTSPT